MAVRLEFAYVYEPYMDPDRYKLKHISERMNKDDSLLCPLCREQVTPKKGPIRQHHFSHAAGADCSASEETILHFNAKHYIKRCINECEELTFYVPSELIDPRLRTVMRIFGIRGYPLSLTELREFYNFKRASVEKQVLDSVADVFIFRGYDLSSVQVTELNSQQEVRGALNHMHSGNHFYAGPDDEQEQIHEKPFVFEVKVTHEMGDEKTKSFKAADIPFLEVVPEQTDQGFVFSATSLSITNFLNNRLELIKGHLAKEYEFELMELVKTTFDAQRKEELKQEVRKELIKEVSSEFNTERKEKLIRQVRSEVIDSLIEDVGYINFREYISAEQFKKMNTIEVKAFRSEVRRRAPLEEIKYKTNKSDGKNFVSINNRYSFYAAENILFDTVKTLHEEYKVELLLGGYAGTDKERVIGFRFLLPDKYLYGEQLKAILRDGLLGIKEIDFDESDNLS
jgi:competence CoiA-like predicted nuclease